MTLGMLAPRRICPTLIAFAALTVATALDAQVRGSERATLTQVIAGTEIVIDYARPSARGRDSLFGGQVHWEEVWTPGANDATTLHVSKDITLNGHQVSAGTYSVWMQVLPGDEWTFMLHEDTTLFHVPHPSLDEGFLTFPVEVSSTADAYETLTFDIQHIRATGGTLVMRWGTTAVTVDLGVDPGFEMTIAAEEAARYIGSWNRVRRRPADSVIAEWTDGMSEERLAEFDEWLAEWLAPATIAITYDAASSHLYVEEPEEDDSDDDAGTEWTMLLLPKGQGFFATGWLMNGELAFAGSDSIWEFEFDAQSVAQRFLMLSADDEIEGEGERTK